MTSNIDDSAPTRTDSLRGTPTGPSRIPGTEFPPIPISTYEDLLEHEQELLERIDAVPNGGLLYLIHPVMLLAEVGASLSEDLQDDFSARHGGIGGWSEEPYRALRRSTSEQPSHVTMRRLFRRSA